MKQIHDIDFILTEDNDLLGTYPYAEVIVDLIQDSLNAEKQRPLNIGLFGYWGSGKSSIITTVESELKSNKKIRFVKYNAWKYSSDDFRRSFLYDLETQLLGINDDSIKKYYSNQKVDDSARLEIPENLVNWIGGLLLVLICASLLLKVEILVLITVFSGVFYFLASKSVVLSRSQTITDKMFSSEQFIKTYNKIIGEDFKNPCVKLFVIVIDDLDRCDKESVFDILRQVKSYLNRDDVVFLIPCDDMSIKNLLDDDLKKQHVDELFRKLFNANIRIKRSANHDLHNYAIKLLENGVYSFDKSNFPNVASMIARGFSNNPRRIIQFLNNLQLEYNLLEKQFTAEAKGSEIDVVFLAKVQILKEEWYDVFELVAYDFRNLQIIEESVLKGSKEVSCQSMIWPSRMENEFKGGKYILSDDLYSFIMSTNHLNVNDIGLYFRLKSSKVDHVISSMYSGDEFGKEQSNEEKFNALAVEIDRCIYQRHSQVVDAHIMYRTFSDFVAREKYEALKKIDRGRVEGVLKKFVQVGQYIFWKKIRKDLIVDTFRELHVFNGAQDLFDLFVAESLDLDFYSELSNHKIIIELAEECNYSVRALRIYYTKGLLDKGNFDVLPNSIDSVKTTRIAKELVNVNDIIDIIANEPNDMTLGRHDKIVKIIGWGGTNLSFLQKYWKRLFLEITQNVTKVELMNEYGNICSKTIDYCEGQSSLNSLIAKCFDKIYSNNKIKAELSRKVSVGDAFGASKIQVAFDKFLNYLSGHMVGLGQEIFFVWNLNSIPYFSDLTIDVFVEVGKKTQLTGIGIALIEKLIQSLPLLRGKNVGKIVGPLIFNVKRSEKENKASLLSAANRKALLINCTKLYLKEVPSSSKIGKSIVELAAPGSQAFIETEVRTYINTIESHLDVEKCIVLTSDEFVLSRLEEIFRKYITNPGILEIGLNHLEDRGYPQRLDERLIKRIFERNQFNNDKRAELLKARMKNHKS